MKLNQIRDEFLKYFESKGHKLIPSSSLIIKDDPSLLFTNAGMNQFKNVFLGLEERSYKKATSCQKCVRAGGKHNDLENVGFTYRHHTFFEMLGNFSFGDYFKKEAITYAWDFLLNTLKIDRNKLYATVYKDDLEAYKIWEKEIGLSKDRIFKFGEKDNFWSMADTGPCGPCSEIFYDHGKEFACSDKCNVGCSCDRFVEIWNLVFMQYNRDESGKLTPLPKPSVDTGAGLERLAAVMQGVANNYDIDVFTDIKKEIASLLKETKIKDHSSYNVIADHIRTIVFLISDGCMPSNEGAGYVLRRIIRRAIRHGSKIGFKEPFLFNIVDKVISIMSDTYKDLKKSKSLIKEILKKEEENFLALLSSGVSLLNKEIKNSIIISGDVAFKLYDTYGFPIDLTVMIAKENNLQVDIDCFNKLMEKQRVLARSSKSEKGSTLSDKEIEILKTEKIKSCSLAYENYKLNSKSLIIIKEDNKVKELKKGDKGFIVFDKTPFYPTSGGQISDTGFIYKNDKKVGKVTDVIKSINIVHEVEALENICLDDYVLIVDNIRRKKISKNHTATHMLHFLLRKYLGSHIKQAGSNVFEDGFTFDFNHFDKIDEEILNKIEEELNEWILKAQDLNVKIMPYDEAISKGACAFFTDKYQDEVRVVSVGESIELCGGLHVENTSDVGVFKIKSESSIASGIRRIEGLTSIEAYKFLTKKSDTLKNISNILKTPEINLISSVLELNSEFKKLKKQNEEFISKLSNIKLNSILDNVKKINGIKYLFINEPNLDLKTYVESIRAKNEDLVSLLISKDGSNLSYVSYVSSSVSDKISAVELIKLVSEYLGGKGGGKNDLARGGGGDASKLSTLESVVEKYINTKL